MFAPSYPRPFVRSLILVEVLPSFFSPSVRDRLERVDLSFSLLDFEMPASGVLFDEIEPSFLFFSSYSS